MGLAIEIKNTEIKNSIPLNISCKSKVDGGYNYDKVTNFVADSGINNFSMSWQQFSSNIIYYAIHLFNG